MFFVYIAIFWGGKNIWERAERSHRRPFEINYIHPDTVHFCVKKKSFLRQIKGKL